MDKDIRLALERAAELKTACPLTERLKEVFSKAMEAGWGEEDFSVLYRLISEKSAKVN
jgi:3-hydroxyisobutyrate dehydrogenase-like beta-hydroxyacid dehydrogenase